MLEAVYSQQFNCKNQKNIIFVTLGQSVKRGFWCSD